ncbi:hypothetical protein JAAARDRAFT_143949 [Jaapia argillacea MUCL 33604]|uniref:C2H2-type domain-containing protein n=1 Tax=Jaapia argillacea MUCL 33604 TaxID=933084 RepID=A0A067P5E5_9AGAM|nr:hypothetical protein JAAARDRAFT_143949 [Jaapia argillacea MUCL 33604]
MPPRRQHNPLRLPCLFPGCGRFFKNLSGLTQHCNSQHSVDTTVAKNTTEESIHRSPSPEDLYEPNPSCPDDATPDSLENDPEPPTTRHFHPKINGIPCNSTGQLTPDADPPMPPPASDYAPFKDRLEFEVADFLFKRTQMSQGNIDILLDLWATSLLEHDAPPPFADFRDMHSLVDSIDVGDAPWRSFSVSYSGEIPTVPTPPHWMNAEYEVWYRDPLLVTRNMLGNRGFEGKFDPAAYKEFGMGGTRRYGDVMSAEWAWRQSDIIASGDDEATRGAMFAPIILGSDKTTVSVATGQNEYYPLYLSNGVFHGDVRRAHSGALIPIAFLAIPKSDRKDDGSALFRKFRRQLFHSSIAAIFETMKPFFSKPDITLCPDGHYRRVIYGFGPYIADYPEQVLLAGIVSGWCPKCTSHPKDLDAEAGRRSTLHTQTTADAFDPGRLWDDYGIIADIVPFTEGFPHADIYEILSPDLLHQVIKGTFKDHLVSWVGDYLKLRYGESRANQILDDIDHRIAAAPLFPKLRRFPEGRRFKQWTGDDSKALMKVYLPAIAGHVPPQMVRCIADFMEFCYLARRTIIDTDTLEQMRAALQRFHTNRQIFEEEGVRPDGCSLPRQHSLTHYFAMIESFGAPNGLCSSITESRHITAVKEPWRRSNRYDALGQMLVTNQRLDKLTAARAGFTSRGLLQGTCLSQALTALMAIPTDREDDDGGASHQPRAQDTVKLAQVPARGYPRQLEALAERISQPELVSHTRRFLFQELHPEDKRPNTDIRLEECLQFNGPVSVFHSAQATFYAPSDLSGVGGMYRERIRAMPSWRKGPGRYDCVFVHDDPSVPRMAGLDIAWVRLFFSFKYLGKLYSCALVEWFVRESDSPDSSTGMWIVEPQNGRGGRRDKAVISTDCVFRGAHLIPVFGNKFLPDRFPFTSSLDCFRSYYVNKYADHHANEIAF